MRRGEKSAGAVYVRAVADPIPQPPQPTHSQWRKIMRLAKTESLKKDIEIISQNHERDVDRKDAILQMLDRDLEEAEEQLQMALRAHLINVDQLLKLHDTRLYDLERRFQQELKTIQTDFHKEKELMTEKFKQEKKELNAIITAVDGEEEERENEAKHAFEQLREEIRNRNLEDINMLRISLDAQIEELEQNFETAHLNYLQQTAQRTHDFKELTQNDQRLSAEIDQRRKKIDALQTTIQQWRAKIRTLSRDTEERNRLLLEEKHSIQKHYQQLKQRIQVYRCVPPSPTRACTSSRIHPLTLFSPLHHAQRNTKPASAAAVAQCQPVQGDVGRKARPGQAPPLPSRVVAQTAVLPGAHPALCAARGRWRGQGARRQGGGWGSQARGRRVGVGGRGGCNHGWQVASLAAQHKGQGLCAARAPVVVLDRGRRGDCPARQADQFLPQVQQGPPGQHRH